MIRYKYNRVLTPPAPFVNVTFVVIEVENVRVCPLRARPW